MEMLEINVVRHAESKSDDLTIGLSDIGMQEARDLGLKYDLNGNYPKTMISPFHPRFTSTLALMTRPELKTRQISRYITESIIIGRFVINNDLDYRSPEANPEFQYLMDKAYKDKENLRFLFTEAEKFNTEKIEISSAQSMHNVMAKTIQDQVHEYDNQVSTSAINIICAREFFFPSFKLEMINRVDGSSAANNYIEWYSENMERTEFAHLKIGKIAIIGCELSREVTISDDFGELSFGIKNAYSSNSETIFDKENLC